MLRKESSNRRLIVLNPANQIYPDELKDDHDREEDEIDVFLQSPKKKGLCSGNEPALLT